MKSMRYALCVVAAGISSLALTSSGSAREAKIAQVDGTGQAYDCQNTDTFQTIPDLLLSLRTRKGHVVVTFTAQVGLSTAAIAQIRPVIDGQPPDDATIFLNNGANQGTIATPTFTRVYLVSQGPHTFGVQYACPGSGQIIINRRWLTVYEVDSE